MVPPDPGCPCRPGGKSRKLARRGNAALARRGKAAAVFKRGTRAAAAQGGWRRARFKTVKVAAGPRRAQARCALPFARLE